MASHFILGEGLSRHREEQVKRSRGRNLLFVLEKWQTQLVWLEDKSEGKRGRKWGQELSWPDHVGPNRPWIVRIPPTNALESFWEDVWRRAWHTEMNKITAKVKIWRSFFVTFCQIFKVAFFCCFWSLDIFWVISLKAYLKRHNLLHNSISVLPVFGCDNLRASKKVLILKRTLF